MIWLPTLAGEMNRIMRCDWLPERAEGRFPTRCVPQENTVPLPCNKYFIDQACAVRMAGYGPCGFCVFMDRAETGSKSINALAALVFYISLVFSNARRILSRFIIWLCLTRIGKYRIHEFDWLKSILPDV